MQYPSEAAGRRRGLSPLLSLLLLPPFLLFPGCGSLPAWKEDASLPRARWVPLRAGPSFTSFRGRPIETDVLGEGPVNIHFHAGIHGNEPEGVDLLERLESLLLSRPDLVRGLRIVMVKRINPDGLAMHTRYNANGVDLNRNFPARNWKPLPRGRAGGAPLSEPETRAIAELFSRWPPSLVVTLHAARRSVNWDGPCRDLAERMAAANHYRLESTVGYPTPGSLGSWLGKDKDVAVITLELRRGTAEELWKENREALLEAVRWARERFLSGPPGPSM